MSNKTCKTIDPGDRLNQSEFSFVSREFQKCLNECKISIFIKALTILRYTALWPIVCQVASGIKGAWPGIEWKDL